jgi:hypothetical protein
MRTPVLIIALLSSIPACAADFDIKPGLWTVTNSMQISGAPPIPNLDKMTPEQRARIEAAMKNMAAPQSVTAKSCITKESIEKALTRAGGSSNNSCTPKLVTMTSSKVEMHVECTQTGDVKSKGDITIERRDSEHFTGSGAAKTTTANGRTMDLKMSMTGAFVSSDCGDVRPAQ